MRIALLREHYRFEMWCLLVPLLFQTIIGGYIQMFFLLRIEVLRWKELLGGQP